MRFALDSNILVYSFIRDDTARRSAAVSLVRQSVEADCILPVQVLGEFLNVIRRKQPDQFTDACAQAERWSSLMPVAETNAANIIGGAQLALRHRLQFWDSVLCEVARSAGAEILLSEDMQDGRDIEGLRVANPFLSSNAQLVAELLASPGG